MQLNGSQIVLETLKEQGKNFIFLTNNSSKNANDYVEKMKKLGFPCEKENVFTSGMAAGMFLRDNKKGKKVDTKQPVAISNDIKHPELYKILTAWRANKAKELARPAYTVLHQKALIGIVNLLPMTKEELLIIPSVGKVTVEKYGAELLEILSNFQLEVGL